MAALHWLMGVRLAKAQHTHVQVSYATAGWRLFVYDFDSGESDPALTPFVVGHAAMGFVPRSPMTNVLGAAGASVWTLPENSVPNLIHLGLGSSGIAPGTFLNNQIRLELHSATGPGHFALYNIGAFGQLVLHMNTRDGISSVSESIPIPAVGGHVHANWAFSAPGVYCLGFAASGVLASTGARITSSVVEFTFLVEDVPWRPQLTLSRSKSEPGLQMVVRGAAGRSCVLETSLGGSDWTQVTNFIFSADTHAMGLPVVHPFALYRARIVVP